MFDFSLQQVIMRFSAAMLICSVHDKALWDSDRIAIGAEYSNNIQTVFVFLQA